jgi:hypothetical protein
MTPGMMPILHSPEVMMPGQLGPISLRAVGAQRGLDVKHVQHRNAFGDADDDLDAGIGRFQDRVGGERGRHVDHRRLRAGLPHRVAHGVEHGQVRGASARPCPG